MNHELSSPDLEEARIALRRSFGHADLRPAQESALVPILAGRDAVIIMPTGSGKSLCFQLPAVLSTGLTLVISPLISLMKDQVDSLCAHGLAAATLNSHQSAEESRSILQSLRRGTLTFLYVAPERLGSAAFLDAISQRPLARVAIDEAHCVSTWGHDFRPDYLRIPEFLDLIGRPSIVALTATATPLVRTDIARVLRLRDPEICVSGFDRPNLSIFISRSGSAKDRERRLIEGLSGFDEQSGAAIVYAATRKNTELAATILRGAGHTCEVYHAGLSSDERTRVQDAFMQKSCQIVVATNAFGMGIDRSDVRLVLHFDVPGSLEAYYQEIGRAGRDDKPAEARLIFNETSVRLQNFFIDMAHPGPALIRQAFEAVVGLGFGDELQCGVAPESVEEKLGHAAKGPMVQSAINRLIGWGILARRGADRELFVVGTEDELEARLDENDLDQRRVIDADKLQTVLSFARGSDCRRNQILHYFQAEFDGTTCGRCDVCLEEARPAGEALSEANDLVLKKILSGVARTRGYAGKTKIALMLIGSKAQDIAGTWLERLSTYGLLAGLTREQVVRRIEAAMDGRLIEVAGDKFPVLRLSDAGWRALKSEDTAVLDWPSDIVTSGAVARPYPALAPSLNDEDTATLERLRAWRNARAAERGVPAYVIFGNRTLNDLVTARPESPEDLEDVYGLGPARVRDHGESILEILWAKNVPPSLS